ncbi:MAG: winged helix-turn-helix transcriptional regulator [Tannerellaceae bacterium]|nr:winged helix-turn-helix transcriptional regulator [Tannerellaceae bacterium]
MFAGTCDGYYKWQMEAYHCISPEIWTFEIRTLPQLSNKMYMQSIRELERSGMIERIVYAVIPPKVEYQLTKAGYTLLPIVLDLARWGIEVSQTEKATL